MSEARYQITEEEASRGGQNNDGFTSEEAAEASQLSWWANRDLLLKQYPKLWDEYGDWPPRYAGGEIVEWYDGEEPDHDYAKGVVAGD